MAFETVLYEKIDNIAKITLNRPEKRNAESQLMSKEIHEAIHQAEEDGDVKVIILAGAGKSFSSGHDMGGAAAADERAAPRHQTGSLEHFLAEESRWVKPMLALRDMGKPIIAQVQGYTIMGGCMLAMMCDFVIASEDARFSERASRQGGYSTEFFAYVYELGAKKAKEYLMTGDYFDAQEAYRLGMVNKVVSLDKLEEETMDFAKKLAMQTASSLKYIKQAVNYVQDLMGYRQAVQYGFNVHMLTHAQRALLPPDAEQAYAGQGGMSVKERLAARDAKFREGDVKDLARMAKK